MKKTTRYLILSIILALLAPPEIAAQNDPMGVETYNKHAIGLKFGRMVSDF